MARAADRILDHGVDVLMAVGVGLTRMAASGMITVPRLFVAASCRTVERLANHESEEHRQKALEAALDCRRAFKEGIAQIDQLLTLLDESTTPEGKPS